MYCVLPVEEARQPDLQPHVPHPSLPKQGSVPRLSSLASKMVPMSNDVQHQRSHSKAEIPSQPMRESLARVLSQEQAERPDLLHLSKPENLQQQTSNQLPAETKNVDELRRIGQPGKSFEVLEKSIK